VKRRRLGQHFLNHPQLAEKIVGLAAVGSQDVVLEVGPGRGVLTDPLLKACRHLIAIETDPNLVEELSERFGQAKNFTLLHEDVLRFDFSKLSKIAGQKIKVVANLPYSIATEIIFRLIDHRNLFSELTLMVQKEVADRLVAGPGSKTYGVLSVLTQLYSESRIVLKVPPGAFRPPPKVDSAVVAMHLSEQPRVPVENVDAFKKLVRAAFATRRKMLRNALKSYLQGTEADWKQIRIFLNVDDKVRAEQLSLEQFAALCRRLS
jgi:16S rRNA (adenine1518-N6/adenine1519-N6)-dimethyltransferase